MPKQHQKQALKWLLSHPEGALFLDPGLGKTSVALEAFRLLQEAGGAKRMLVVAPLRPAAMVWTKNEGGELARWTQFEDLEVSLIHGGAKARQEAVDRDADIYVINYDGLGWLVESGNLADLVRRGCDVLCFDELSKMKHPKTKRFKTLKPHLGKFKRRWGLTGSPVANGLMDLFGEVYALDLGRRLGKYITHYRHQFFMSTGFGGYTWVPQEGAQERIYHQIKDLALSMRAEDHLDMPPMVEQDLWVDLPYDAMQVYSDMEDDLIAQIDAGSVIASNAAVASGKCRQIASGGIYYDGEDLERGVEHIHDAKSEALKDLVDELQGAPLLIAYEFDHDLQRIRQTLGDVPVINGETSTKRSAELANAWNLGALPILAGHPAAMGHGLNLQQCGHHVCWYSLTWNFELYDQTVRRVYRQGQRNRVIVYRILARKTVDVAVARAIRNKGKGQSALFEALRDMRRGR